MREECLKPFALSDNEARLSAGFLLGAYGACEVYTEACVLYYNKPAVKR